MKTEPIGSIPRPPALIEAMQGFASGSVQRDALDAAYAAALKDTIERFEATGSPVISDGEQTKPSFATYPLTGIETLAPDGVVIPFADGHTRQLPRLTAGPFRYGVHAASFLKAARLYAEKPVKQAVISASALSLLYPAEPIAGYPREAFLADLIAEAQADIRGPLEAGADSVQIDFTEGRLSLKLDPRAGCCAALSRSTTRCSTASAMRSARASGYTCVPAAIMIPRTARMWIMQGCCRSFSS
jgi:5-methyltetrahydropteroyltriglutamate--homocysteine methyltransferase